MDLPPIEPMRSYSSVDVLVDVSDPNSGEVIEQRKETVMRSEVLDAASQVRHDTADMYEIENLIEAGIQPQFLNSAYLRATIDDFGSAEKMSTYVENLLQEEEYQASLKKEVTPSPSSSSTPSDGE